MLNMNSSKNTKIFLLGFAILIIVLVSYSNHFTNGFYFDDSHVINSNGAIRDIGNIALFFTDPTTFSSLPANQAYRPMVTLMNAVDYWLAGNELNPVYFHLHIFFWYLLQCVLMFFLLRNIFWKAGEYKWGEYIALFAVGWYAVHTANSETINYISARSDSFSTLCVVACLLLFQYDKTRRYFVYMIPLVLGILTKQTTVMVYPLLFLYLFFFESGKRNLLGGFTSALKASAPVGIVVIGIFLFNQLYFTPETTVSSNTSVTKLQYFSTQWFVITHYLGNFFIPINLSADPDIFVIEDLFSLKKLWGLSVIIVMLGLAYKCYQRIETRPIAFGILWFFVALLPTSSFVPLYQMSNDHRTFFPYIGLVLAVSHGLAYLILKWENEISKSDLKKGAIVFAVFLVFIGYGFGTFQRNEVWSSGESLWHDVTIKSPGNSRGLMNYGTALMAKGDYEGALSYFERTLALAPRYSYAHVNMGVLLGASGKQQEAEEYFKNGIAYGRNNPEAFYFYGNWLIKRERFAEARTMLEKALVISPQHTKSQVALEKVKAIVDQNWESQLAKAMALAKGKPNHDNYLNLSLAYYKVKNWEESINAARRALQFNPKGIGAYNNIGTALIHLGRYDEAIQNFDKALEIEPNYQLAKNNYNWAMQMKNENTN